MINILDTLKQAYDVSTTQIDKIIVDNEEYRINEVEYYDDVYEEGNIFGTAIARCLDFEIENIVNLEGKEIEYQTGIVANGVTQWINLGKFIVQTVEPNDTINITKINAMDYMLKTNTLYESTLNYADGTVTLLDVLQEVCEKSGISLATMEFTNSNFIVDSNQFAEGTLNRQVIQAVAQVSGTVAKIKNDNRLYLVNPNAITEVSKVFTLNNYKEAEIKRNTQPINVVSLGMANIEGENITLRDETSIATKGENILVINDNPFAYTQAKREQLITALFAAVKGFEYKAFSFKCQGLPYLETTDKVQFQDKEGNIYNSYIFRFNYKSPNGLESAIEAPSIIKATVAYQNVSSALEIAKRTEILVDKQNQTIESVVSQTDEQNQKIAQVTQKVDEINSKISDIADITISADGYGSVSLANINQSEPVYIRIRPTSGEDISYLYPRDNLYPSDTLFMPDRIIRFASVDYTVDYELPNNLLYYDENNYDEFILDYNARTCVVNKKVGYNADGTKYVLENPTTIEYDYPTIPLEKGDYTVSLPGYSNQYMFVRLMVQNIYTDQFATKAEVKSEISQTAHEINLGVDKKLINYSTTTQMNAAINVKANEITSRVSEQYETKANATNNYSELKQTATSLQSQISSNDTDISSIKQNVNEVNIEVGKKYNTSDFTNAQITAKLNDGTSQVKLKADKINLSAEDILNLIAGNTINLTSRNISISSDNFTVDKNGKVTALNINVIGGKIRLTGGSSSANTNFEVYLAGDADTKTSVNAGQVFLDTNDGGIYINNKGDSNNYRAYLYNDNSDPQLYLYGNGTTRVKSSGITTPNVTQTSLESIKKNISESEINALEIIKNAKVYSYNLKTEKDTDKKHIGFVIGDKYNTPDEVIAKSGKGIDTYTMASLMWKALQESNAENEKLKQRIEKLEART